METRSRTRSMLRGAAVLAALGALTAPATAGAAVKAPVIKSVTPSHVTVGQKLIIRGKYFRLGKGRNRVLFQRSGGKSVFVKADVSTKVRMTVVVPKALELYMPSSGGSLVPARFRLRVLTTKLSRAFTSLKNSPIVGPAKPKSTGGTGTGGPGAPATPDGDCDGDGIKNSADPDDDNDLLPDQLELAIGTDPCNPDTDGDGVEDGYEYQSAIDLNNDDYQNANAIVPYPGKRPYPNPLYKDADVDYDGDGLSLGTEYQLWKYTYTVNHTATRTLTPLSYSDGTRYSLLPGGTKMTDAAYTPPQAFSAWASLAGYANPLLHDVGGSTWAAYNLYDFDRDGNVTTTAAEAVSANQMTTEKYYWDLDGDGYVSDDERDEDGDGLTNYDETIGRMTPEYWQGCYQTEKPYPIAYAGTSVTDPDTDGDGILDGADDQDHDDVPNIMELSRQMASDRNPDWGAAQCHLANPAPSPSPLVPQGRVNPFNPCLPDANSRTCERHPGMSDSFAPFDDNGPKYFVLN
jgi:hypothetical protein